MSKIGVIGSRDTVLCFKALGMDVFPTETPTEARATFRKLSSEDTEYAIIYVEENLAEPLQADIAKCKLRLAPAVILIPGRDGSLGIGRAALRKAVEDAVGSDLIGAF